MPGVREKVAPGKVGYEILLSGMQEPIPQPKGEPLPELPAAGPQCPGAQPPDLGTDPGDGIPFDGLDGDPVTGIHAGILLPVPPEREAPGVCML